VIEPENHHGRTSGDQQNAFPMEEVVVMCMMLDPDLDAVAGESAAEPPSPEAAVDDPNAVYALGSSRGESARLQRQAEELAPDSAALLDRVGPRPGDSAIDLGCGPRGVIDLLAERVAPGGRVVGLDADPGARGDGI
jgi:hypothetical protein